MAEIRFEPFGGGSYAQPVAEVAQLVEQLIRNQQAACSSRVLGTPLLKWLFIQSRHLYSGGMIPLCYHLLPLAPPVAGVFNCTSVSR